MSAKAKKEPKVRLREVTKCGKQGTWTVLGVKLKPCPFCGRKVTMRKNSKYDRAGAKLCHQATIFHEDETAWNEPVVCMMDATTFGWRGTTWTERDELVKLWNERATT